MTTGDADHGEPDLVAMRARVAAAPQAADIQNLADRAIDEIRVLADEAAAKARQVDQLMTRLSELLERSDES
jgi:hypothetical protein